MDIGTTEHTGTGVDMKLTRYQVTVIETWIADAHARGNEREDALARVLCGLPGEHRSAVRSVFEASWPNATQQVAT